MARTKTLVAEAVELPALNGEMLTANQNVMATMQSSHSEERDLVNQMLGQIQMSRAISKFTDVVSLQKLKSIKETKMYRALAGQKGFDREGNEIADVGTFDGFCRALGTSASKVDEDLKNLDVFGEEALQQLAQIGAGYRDLRKYRRLPEDEQAALIEVAKAGDKDAFLDLAEEIISRHAKEKTELTQRLDDVNADYEAQGEVMAKRSGELDQTKMELEKARKRIQSATPDDVIKDLRSEVTALSFEIESKVMGSLREGFTLMAEHANETGQDHREFQADLIRQLETTLATVRSEFHLPASLVNSAPVWMNTEEA
ncbi:hypothetical protein [Pseudomonas sp. WS 5079]|uniref:hypothetical protein n=1 Tax=Pseudomonas sp. WS 5079 TaxID=2717492 RepID=UPI001553DDEF|nr:hypothetical protein [Pseudomonas sp. WS 5079]NMX64736.1 hypothetical protein [Pseudomonas sp. WS 5079]